MRWNDDLIERELRVLIARFGRYPIQREFEEARARYVQQAVWRHGGREYWAERLGVQETLVERSGGFGPHWTEASIERELRKFIGDDRRWPTRREFIAAGHERLRSAVGRNGGVQHWAKRLDKELARNQVFGGYGPEEVLRDAREVIAAHGYLPSANTLFDAGHGRLASRIRRHGGAAHFRASYGI